MLMKRIEIERKQEAKRQARIKKHLEFKRDYGYYENLTAEKARKRQRENLENETGKKVRNSQYNKDGTHAEDQPKTMRYSFNENGEIIDVNKRLIVPRKKLKKF